MLYVLNDEELKKEIMTKAYHTPYLVHSRGTKMFRDLSSHYWWVGMRKHIVDFIKYCLVCQQVKVEHQRLTGLLQPLLIPKWKWGACGHGFCSWPTKDSKGYNSIYVIVDRLTKSTHFPTVKKTFSMK